MAQNLNFRTPDGSWCYDNHNSDGKKYGRLYTWNAAITASPDGWHLPTLEDWNALEEVVGDSAGAKLKVGSGYHGEDVYGFSAVLGGAYNTNGDFCDVGEKGYWWTATEKSDDRAYHMLMYIWDNYTDIGILYDKVIGSHNLKGSGYSVRCVRD